MNGEPQELGETLLVVARESIAEALGGRVPQVGRRSRPELEQPGASFVTLRLDGELRGCIGSLEPRRALYEDVRLNARAAALDDPRFTPLRVEELERVRLEVSLLSSLEPIEAASEPALLTALEPGRHGLMIEKGPRRATFLPQVWSSLSEPREFLRQLEKKAGFAWSPQVGSWRYTVRKWSEA